jgi:hypothetical protein
MQEQNVELAKLKSLYLRQFKSLSDDISLAAENGEEVEYRLRLWVLNVCEAISVFSKLGREEDVILFRNLAQNEIVTHVPLDDFEDFQPYILESDSRTAILLFGMLYGLEPELIAKLVGASIEKVIMNMDKLLPRELYLDNWSKGIERLRFAYEAEFDLQRRQINEVIEELDFDELLSSDENNRLEFKSTFRFCLKANDYKDYVKEAVVKTIAAFLNSGGGTLVIGQSDNKEPIDLCLDQKKEIVDEDLYSRQLVQELRKTLDPYPASLIEVSFPKYKGHVFCRVDVLPNEQDYVYSNMGGKDGRFFVRNTSETVELSPKDAMAHQKLNPRPLRPSNLRVVK